MGVGMMGGEDRRHRDRSDARVGIRAAGRAGFLLAILLAAGGSLVGDGLSLEGLIRFPGDGLIIDLMELGLALAQRVLRSLWLPDTSQW